MKEPLLLEGQTVRDAIAVIERTRKLIAAVVDSAGRLRGVVSDGDIRRALLAGHGLDQSVTVAMTETPIVGSDDDSPENLYQRMLALGVAALPLVDTYGRFVRVVQISDGPTELEGEHSAEQFWGAVIMAGGEGRRLRPLTASVPKPMISVGGVPLLERQIRGMVASGLTRIFVSTNYLGHVIEDHFGDGSLFGAEISYLREKEKLGTAGALSLLPIPAQGPLLVINGDVLTKSDYGRMLKYHREHGDFLTVGAVQYRVEIPFGVINIEGTRAIRLEEKPSQRFLCNAGIYVLSPAALAHVPAEGCCNMTDVISAAIDCGQPVSVFPIHEYWTDIGSPGDLETAQKVFEEGIS